MNSSQKANLLLIRKKNLALSLESRDTWLVAVESTVGVLILLTAFLGNILVCFAIFKTRTLRQNPQNYFIVSLALTDVLYALLCMAPGVGVLATGTWPFDNITCQIQGCFALILGAVSLVTMAMIAVNRYFKIVRSKELYQKVFSENNILVFIGASWTYAIFQVLIPFGFVRNVYEVRIGRLECYPELDQNETVRLMILVGYITIVTLSFPSIVFSYYKVYRKVRAHFLGVMNSTVQDNNARSFVNEVKIAKMLFATFICFFICWIPALTIDQLEAIRGHYIFPRQLYLLGLFGVQASSAMNPLIYGLLRREFREAYKNMLKCGQN